MMRNKYFFLCNSSAVAFEEQNRLPINFIWKSRFCNYSYFRVKNMLSCYTVSEKLATLNFKHKG